MTDKEMTRLNNKVRKLIRERKPDEAKNLLIASIPPTLKFDAGKAVVMEVKSGWRHMTHLRGSEQLGNVCDFVLGIRRDPRPGETMETEEPHTYVAHDNGGSVETWANLEGVYTVYFPRSGRVGEVESVNFKRKYVADYGDNKVYEGKWRVISGVEVYRPNFNAKYDDPAIQHVRDSLKKLGNFPFNSNGGVCKGGRRYTICYELAEVEEVDWFQLVPTSYRYSNLKKKDRGMPKKRREVTSDDYGLQCLSIEKEEEVPESVLPGLMGNWYDHERREYVTRIHPAVKIHKTVVPLPVLMDAIRDAAKDVGREVSFYFSVSPETRHNPNYYWCHLVVRITQS